MKVISKVYKGIEYIEINDLPKIQQDKLAETLQRDLLIKILIDNKIVGNCLQYKDYEVWFDTIYKRVAAKAVQENVSLDQHVMEMRLSEA